MLTNSLSMKAASSYLFNRKSSPEIQLNGTLPESKCLQLSRSIDAQNYRYNSSRQYDRPSAKALQQTVEILPPDSVKRRMVTWRGMMAELVQATSHEKIEYRFRSSMHLLVVYEQGMRHDGETFVEGLPRSTLRDLTLKLVFVPAGHEYRGWHELRTLVRLIFFYIDPAKLEFHSESNPADAVFIPRLFFEDATLRNTALKLKRVAESPMSQDQLYLEALGAVFLHELARVNRGAPCIEPRLRGGLAPWQQRIVTNYIEEHLTESIPIATLAQLARLSPYYFCRAFKQSLGVPPHRYHSNRRIERAKTLLAKPGLSVTEIGLTLGFSETSSFTAAFRKATGLTPTAYHRSLG